MLIWWAFEKAFYAIPCCEWRRARIGEHHFKVTNIRLSKKSGNCDMYVCKTWIRIVWKFQKNLKIDFCHPSLQ